MGVEAVLLLKDKIQKLELMQMTVKASIQACKAQKEVIAFDKEIEEINAREEYDDRMSRNKDLTRRKLREREDEEANLNIQDIDRYISL